MYSHLAWKQTVSIVNWHTHTGQSLPDHSAPGLHLGYSLWKLFSPLWHKHQILWSDLRCNNGSWTLSYTIPDMSTSQWTVLISMPFQLLANPPTCIAALYTKSKAGIASKCSLQLHKTTTTILPTQITPDVWILTTPATAPLNTVTLICPEKPMEMFQIWQPIHILKLPMACSATSSHFYLPPRYETPMLDANVSLNMANLQMIDISAQCFRIWQHSGNNKSDMQLQHLATIPSIPVHKVYQHLLNSTMQNVPFNTDPSEDTDSSGVCSPIHEYTFQL